VRQRLLTAAVQLIPELGWSAVSTRILAERAGVSASVVHYHFSGVQAVLSEAALTAMRQVLDASSELVSSAQTPAESIDALLASVAPYDGTDPTSLLFVEAYLAATRDEGLGARLAAIVQDFRDRSADWFRLHQVADPEAAAAVLAAAIDGLLLHRSLGPTPDVSAVLRKLVS
jgi:DNA-binding transcriptional regulator YbjK